MGTVAEEGSKGYKAVNPHPKGGLVSWVVDMAEKLVVEVTALYGSRKPLHFLSGNFAPVSETAPKSHLPVVGHLPSCLDGEFVRVGPNPKFAPVAGYHWFDGDGMIHGLRIKDGKATYVSRYVKTSRLKQEEYFGRAKFFKEMVKGGLIMSYDTTKKARFGILPRYAKDDLQMRWFELPNCYIFHNANAWEEGDEVILYTCRLPDLDLEMVSGPVKENMKNFQNELYEMRFNLKSGEASQKKMSESAVDFPRINEKYIGRKQRYVYGTILDSVTQVKGLVKFDLQAEPEFGKSQIEMGGNVLGVVYFGPGRFGSEAIFVPQDSGPDLEEDDGYLICFVHDENTGKSEVNVFDAKTMCPEPVAIVHLPTRVPYGFHAFFVSEGQLQNQT